MLQLNRRTLFGGGNSSHSIETGDGELKSVTDSVFKESTLSLIVGLVHIFSTTKGMSVYCK